MTIAKKIFWVLLYLVTIIPAGLSLYFYTHYTDKDLVSALISSLITLLIYTILIFKNIKILSIISFVTLLVMSFFMFSVSAASTKNPFSSVLDEKTFMLTLSLIIFFLLVNSIFWLQTKKGLLKIISMLYFFLSFLLLVLFGALPPDYHQNFVYTRINILIFLILGIYLIKKKKKLLGILAIFMSVGMLLLSTVFFIGTTYTSKEIEQQEVIAFVDPLVKEMFGYYNQKDYTNFFKDLMVSQEAVTSLMQYRDALGPYVYFGKPNKVIRKVGSYRVEYPVKFQNKENMIYVTFILSNISPGSAINDFSFSNKQEGNK